MYNKLFNLLLLIYLAALESIKLELLNLIELKFDSLDGFRNWCCADWF